MTTADRLIDDLLQRVARQPRLHVGCHFIGEVITSYRSGTRSRDLPTDGFRPELIANNQRGQLYRHLQLHIGLLLLGGPFRWLSSLAHLIDHLQAGKGRAESKTELLDNYAAFLCATQILAYYNDHLPFQSLRRELHRILTSDN